MATKVRLLAVAGDIDAASLGVLLNGVFGGVTDFGEPPALLPAPVRGKGFRLENLE